MRAFTTEGSLMFRRSALKKNDAVLLKGPLTLPLNNPVLYEGVWATKGLSALKIELVSLNKNCPWNLFVPGLVKISIRP